MLPPCPARACETSPDDPPPWYQADWPVGGGHHLRVTQHGRRDGPVALVLHGGPGSGLSPLLRRGFDLRHWRVVGLDQRGAGASQPAGGTAHNTTADLLDDLRRLRAHLGIARWLVVGGSWGATLAVAHAADQPDAVSGLLLRAAFLARDADIAAFFDPARAPDALAAEAWQALARAAAGPGDTGAPAPGALLGALAARLAEPAAPAPPSAAQQQVALAWRRWEQALAGAGAGAGAAPGPVPGGPEAVALVRRYQVQAHYLLHGCWLRRPTLLQRAAACPAVPTLLLHGTADRICPGAGAQALQRHLPAARLQWVEGAGHDPAHPGMAAAQRAALAHFAAHRAFDDRAAA